MTPLPMTRVVVFDVGETLVDESRLWLRHAKRLGIAPMTFLGVFGALVSEGRNHRDVFEFFGVDADVYLAELDARCDPEDGILAGDLYPDAASTLTALRAAGHRVGIVGNQPTRAAEEIRVLGLAVDVVATSAGWGVAKPDPAFFERVARECGAEPEEITYVGDRLDNDVLPAQRSGMHGVLVRRGVWGHLHARSADSFRADRIVDSLSELLSG